MVCGFVCACQCIFLTCKCVRAHGLVHVWDPGGGGSRPRGRSGPGTLADASCQDHPETTGREDCVAGGPGLRPVPPPKSLFSWGGTTHSLAPGPASSSPTGPAPLPSAAQLPGPRVLPWQPMGRQSLGPVIVIGSTPPCPKLPQEMAPGQQTLHTKSSSWHQEDNTASSQDLVPTPVSPCWPNPSRYHTNMGQR